MSVISSVIALSETVTTLAQLVIFLPHGGYQSNHQTTCLPKETLPTPVRADRLAVMIIQLSSAEGVVY